MATSPEKSRLSTVATRAVIAAVVLLIIGGGAATLMIAVGSWGQPSPANENLVYARNARGVPLHPCPKCDKVSGRLPDRTPVHIVGQADKGRWLHVAHAAKSGWIVASYMSEPSTSGNDGGEPGPALAATSPWASRQACTRALAARRHAPASGARSRDVRIGTWNLRWFPDGTSGGPGAEATDVEWMACAIASMDLDVLVVQELKQDTRGRQALLDLLAGLERDTGHRWNDAVDDCPDDGRQHVGLLWDTERVTMSDIQTVGSINPAESACAHRFRPAIAARARFAGGLDVHLVGVHLDSGPKSHDYQDRLTSLLRLADWVRALGPGARVIIAGDFNSMGCPKCEPRVPARGEIAALKGVLGGAGLTDIGVDPPCTEYYEGHGVWLDHFVLDASLAQRVTGARSEGPCAALSCAAPNASTHAAFTHLSDHCPVVVDLGAAPAPSP